MNQIQRDGRRTEMRQPTVRALLTKTALPRRRAARISHALADSGVRTDCGVEPNRISPPFSRISAMPRVRISCALWPSPSAAAARLPVTRDDQTAGATTSRRRTTPARRAARRRTAPHRARAPATTPRPGHGVKAEVHAQHQKIALGEVDDPHHPEDQRRGRRTSAHRSRRPGGRRPAPERSSRPRPRGPSAGCPPVSGGSVNPPRSVPTDPRHRWRRRGGMGRDLDLPKSSASPVHAPSCPRPHGAARPATVRCRSCFLGGTCAGLAFQDGHWPPVHTSVPRRSAVRRRR